MFEMKIHTVRKYGLTINDEDVYFSSKGIQAMGHHTRQTMPDR